METELPVGTVFGGDYVVESLELGVEGLFADLEDFSNTPPTGTVHLSALLASQSAVMIGEVVRYQP